MEELQKLLVGKTLEEAKSICVKKGLRHRVAYLEGKGMLGTRDVNPYRVNFSIEKGLVTEITFG